MRLHHLEITGFGPFADTVRIDFEALSEAGLFLLSGPTGAGKSSILDAVCFALYGDVPGDRSTAKRLRSDQAGDDVVPRVVLEATMAGRRFRIDRSPAWQRPKKRGSGLTTEQARVVISERRATDDDATPWHPLSTRLDETGHLVTRLLGLNLPQFCQVAMLPQGRFQAFLRARSEERHALLQQVFQTGRFDQVERWLRERRVALRRASEAQHTLVADLVSRVSEVTGAAAPEGWDGAPGSLTAWRDDLAAQTDRSRSEAAHHSSAAAAEEVAAQTAAEAGIELAGLIATHANATRSLRSLEAAAPDHAADVRRLESARRAAGVRPLHEVAAHARTAEESADAALGRADGSLAELLGEPVMDGVWVAERRREATGLLIEIARVQPLEATAVEVERERVATTRVLETTRAGLDTVTQRLGQGARRAHGAAGAARGRSWRLGEGRDAPGVARLVDQSPRGRARGRQPDRVVGRGTGSAARGRRAAVARPRRPGGDPRTPARRHGRRDRLPARRRRLVPGLRLRRPPVAGHALLRRTGRSRRATRPQGRRRPRGRGRGPHPAGPRAGDPGGRGPCDGRWLGRGALRRGRECHRRPRRRQSSTPTRSLS